MSDFLGSSTWIALFALTISFVACAGGISILYKEKVIVDERGEVTSVELPFLGKLRTNYPSLVAIFLGVCLAFAVLYKWPLSDSNRSKMPLVATVTLLDSSPRDIFFAAVPADNVNFMNKVPPKTPKEITLYVDESENYFGLAYAVKWLPNSPTQYALEYGSVEISGESGRNARFNTTLEFQ